MGGDALGDRMKAYEARESDRRFLPIIPVCARIDGRNFSSFTCGMDRPWDQAMTDAMIETTKCLVAETHARVGYTQSDEISLVWLSERSDSSIFFDHRIAKMTSVLASFATAMFTRALIGGPRASWIRRMPHFDCRTWSVPSRTEAANVFLWREQDATKNAISMAARAVYRTENWTTSPLLRCRRCCSRRGSTSMITQHPSSAGRLSVGRLRCGN